VCPHTRGKTELRKKSGDMLRKHKKVTKKELKKDPLVIFAAQAVDFLKLEWLKITATVLAVVLVVALSILFVHGRKKGEINAYDAALTAMKNNAPEANDLLKRVTEKYGGTESAAEALIQLGNRYYQQKDLKNSEQCYTEFIKKYAKDPVVGFNAYNNLGSVYEEKGDFKSAARTYESFNGKFKNSVFASIMYLNAGKAYLLAGDKDSARKNFAKITEQYRDSREKQEALYYIETLK
jgi:predicted negative regulator of RcsB-dependent stress response